MFYQAGEVIMMRHKKINLGEVLFALSDALELASPELSFHQIRVAVIALKLARVIGIPEDQIELVYQAALLHDIGALRPEDKISLHRNDSCETMKHCVLGAILFQKIPWLAPSADIVEFHHSTYSTIRRLFDDQKTINIQIVFLADHIERMIDRKEFILNQSGFISGEINKKLENQVHPEVLGAFNKLTSHEEFWLDIINAKRNWMYQDCNPLDARYICCSEILNLSDLFRSVIDYRSNYTAAHSTGVSKCASILARELGFSKPEINEFIIAGRLHDIGKMIVPNAILEKNGGLSNSEVGIIKQHTYYTYSILKQIPGFDRIKRWGAFHHEKLDGNGYPFHIDRNELDLGSRILAVSDIFTAVYEDRPYRRSVGFEKSIEILRKDCRKGKIDKNVVTCLCDSLKDYVDEIKESQHRAKEDYQEIMAFSKSKSREVQQIFFSSAGNELIF